VLSMFASVVVYTWFFGWTFAVGFMVLLFVHEMGHVIAAKHCGVEVSAPVFIPMLGAMISMKQSPQNARDEALIGISGPVVGSAASFVCLEVAWHTGSKFWMALAYIGFFLNLFNLIPIVPFDGGRVVQAIHPALWLVGLLALVVVAVTLTVSPVIFFVVVLGGFELWGRFKNRHSEEARAYRSVRRGDRVLIAIGYVSLVVALIVAMGVSHVATH